MKDLMDLMVEAKLCTDEMFIVAEQIDSALGHGEAVADGVLSVLGVTNVVLHEIASSDRLNEIMNLVDEELPWLVENQQSETLTGPQHELLNVFSLSHECSGIDGYSALSLDARKLFCSTYKVHYQGHGKECKNKWNAISVKDCGGDLEVIFKNGEWLHYYRNGTWG